MSRSTTRTLGLALLITAAALDLAIRDASASLVFHFDPSDTRTTFKNGGSTNPGGTAPATAVGDTIGWIMDTRVPSTPAPNPSNGRDLFIDAQQVNNAQKPIIASHPTSGNVMSFGGSATAGLLVRADNRDLIDGMLGAADTNTHTMIIAGRVDPAISSTRYLYDFHDKAPAGGGTTATPNGLALRYNPTTESLEAMVKQSMVASVPHTPGTWFVATTVWDGPNGLASLRVDTRMRTTSDTGVATGPAIFLDSIRIGNIGSINSGFFGQIGEVAYFNDVADHSSDRAQMAAAYAVPEPSLVSPVVLLAVGAFLQRRGRRHGRRT